MRRLHAPIAALLAALGLAAAGCGGSTATVPELASLMQVAQTSSAAETARFALSLELTVPEVDRAISFSAEGGFDTPARRARMTVDLSSFVELISGLGQGLGSVTGDLGDPEDWKLEAIQDGDVAYVRSPLFAKDLPDGKTWVKGDARDLSGADGQLSRLGSFAGTDPRDVFALLRAVSGAIEPVGSEEIRGVETSHYRAAVDPAKLEQLVPEAQRQALGGVDRAARQAGVTELPLDIWIDADNRVRKLTVDLDAKQPGSDGSVKAALVVEVYDYGKPLDLELPAADQVVDASTLQRTP